MIADDWRDEALCASEGHDPDLFDIGRNASPHGPAAKKAKAVCRRCDVEGDCLEAALVEEGDVPIRLRFMVRGGTTPRERHEIATTTL